LPQGGTVLYRAQRLASRSGLLGDQVDRLPDDAGISGPVAVMTSAQTLVRWGNRGVRAEQVLRVELAQPVERVGHQSAVGPNGAEPLDRLGRDLRSVGARHCRSRPGRGPESGETVALMRRELGLDHLQA